MSQLTLTAPDPVVAIPVEQAAGLVPVTSEVRTQLQGKVDAYVADLLKHDAQSPEFGKVTGQISSIGQKEKAQDYIAHAHGANQSAGGDILLSVS